jgi:hypothetical protein
MIDLTGSVEHVAATRASGLAALEGATIGFLDNTKAHADLVLAAAERELVASHGVAGTVVAKKENRWGPASELVLSQFDTCDAVVIALAD